MSIFDKSDFFPGQFFAGHAPYTTQTMSIDNHAGFETQFVCPVKVCRQLPAKSQSLRLLSIEAETIFLPFGLKFAL
jgi:hypothetical protein